MQESSSIKPIRILYLEDNEHDRELLEAVLQSNELICDLTHAQNRQEFEMALAEQVFDLIVSDFTLPGYDGMMALTTARKTQEQTPFIFVSGTLGEE